MAALFLIPSTTAAAAPARLELRDGGKAALLLANAKPGSSARSCLRITYRGSRRAAVRLHGTTIGTGFDRYLDLRVTRGASCRKGAVVYDGTLAGFPDSLSDAIEERWSPGESHAYRFEVTVRDDNEAQGLETRQTFTWTAAGDTPAAPVTASRPDVGSLANVLGLTGLRKFLHDVARVAAEVGKRSAFPSSLLMLVLGFLSVQNRIDRRDPKLALAPVHPTPDLPFDGPPEDGEPK